ncbi:MAG: thiamine phosphate synthase [Acidobacteria bacterium]|nr:thiamine phosphate synthase [Acidobacteriota bacterium]
MPAQMPPDLPTPIIYLITDGQAKTPTLAADSERLLRLVRAAVRARVSLIQLREKNLSARSLYELTARASALTAGSATKLLVNDRADIARAAGADGVHLTTTSLAPHIVQHAFGADFLIGVSTHTLAEARAAREGGADFAVFGPVFATPSKSLYGAPVGLAALRAAAETLKPFPLIALGGITRENAVSTLKAGASGVAAIRALGEAHDLEETVHAMRWML